MIIKTLQVRCKRSIRKNLPLKSKNNFMLKISSLHIISFLIFFSFHVIGQNQYNTWYFGDSAAVDFNSGIPVALSNSGMYAFEGCAGMCDSSGNILFYTNGGDHAGWQGGVWNRNHVLMPTEI